MAALSDAAGPSTSHLFYQTRQRRPQVDRAEGIYLWDVGGRRYLDGCSGAMVSNIGHGNPRVLAAMQAQMQQTTFAYRLHFENAPAEELAARLATLVGGDLDRVFFVSGGSEAVESCIKLARQHAIAIGQPQRYKVISRYPSYHGSTLGALALTGYTPMTAPFGPMLQAAPQIPAPTVYLDRDGGDAAAAGRRYADLLEQEILRQGVETVLAFIMEPVGGASTGALVAPDTYYPRIREICDRYGVLLIHDEVMCGAGRTGRFLAAEHWGVVPDLIALSKGLGAGYAPLGAMVASRRVVEPVLDAGGFVHGYTYAGNPIACAAGLAVLGELLECDLMGNAERMGLRLRQGLERLKARHALVGDVRGKGLLLAMELVADRFSMTPLPPERMAAARLTEIALTHGLILYWRRTRGGLRGDHVMVCPPLIINGDQVDELLELLDAALSEWALEMSRA